MLKNDLNHRFIKKATIELERDDLEGLTDATLEHLVKYDWPGNVRELENLIDRAVLLAEGDSIDIELPPAREPAEAHGPHQALERETPLDFGMKRARQAFEADLIRRALIETGGNRTHAAKLLEISHRALLYKIKDYEIDL